MMYRYDRDSFLIQADLKNDFRLIKTTYQEGETLTVEE